MLFTAARAAHWHVNVTQSPERMLDRVKVGGETLVGTRQHAVQELTDHFSTRHALLCCQPVECRRLLLVEVYIRSLHTPYYTPQRADANLGSSRWRILHCSNSALCRSFGCGARR